MDIGVLLYEGRWPIFGSNDYLHVAKRYAFHLASPSRTIFWGDIWTDLSGFVGSGLSLRAYAATDVQSDKQAAQKLCPPLKSTAWYRHGAVISAWISALLSSGWTGSRLFSVAESVQNACFAYYFMLAGLYLAVARMEIHPQLTIYIKRYPEVFQLRSPVGG